MLPFQKYYKPLKTPSPEKSPIVTNVLLDDIFFQIPQILAHHEAFFKDLKARLEGWEAKQTIGDWFLESARQFSYPNCHLMLTLLPF